MDSDAYSIFPFDINISPPSISSLSTDALSLIFETLILTNTSRNEGLPLSQLIRASQVCHDWREITLDSPLLWGRCISLNHPILLEEQWRKEILRRSGKAPLWIQGKMLMEKITNFFFAIIKEEWERVQVLDVILVDSSDMWNGAWAPILRPSPMLQIFKLANEFSPFTRYPAPFLTDHAPQIKIFRSSNISFNLHAPWISHIQELTIRGSFSLPDVLAALRNMRKIRHLQINFTNVGSDVVECPSPVHLPDLEELMIGNCRHRIWAPVLATIASTQCRSFELASNCGL
ncbi:hypothetical protein CPB84DRAFT_622371 [Gymnopilus junonius]|uniref:F-box domain-containing protein n=1 Tax=Gymnopilus junonius TaxID=109634 RepID=A0A9P5NAP6_GYMJU|nr:hypothetical protein CPB84DRAFT_622371 [Gymnopilus junonius]